MEQLTECVWLDHSEAEGFSITTALVVTGKRGFVFDTAASPQAMAGTARLLKEKDGKLRVIVVNSHHHWDHVYGNAAFAGHDILAHRACPRLMIAQRRTTEDVPPEPLEGVPLPTITFGDRLSFSDERDTVHLIHTPGHSEDSIVLYLDECRVLLGGDIVEWPFPTFAQRQGAEVWIRTLRRLKQLVVDRVVPCHGPTMSKAIIDANERYITEVYEAVAKARDAGVGRDELDLPVERFVGEGVVVDQIYHDSHRSNLAWAYDDM
jgi:cyclase